MIRTILFVAVAAGIAALTAGPGPARAAESYDNCTGFISSLPATISTQGTWCLNKDLSTNMTSGNAITVATNNVTIDCNHFKIGGLEAGDGTQAYGIFADSRFNAAVRHCNVRGFQAGIRLSGGGHLVERNSLDGNTWIGIQVSGAGSTVRDNQVIDTGGSTSQAGTVFGILGTSGTDIIDNTVNGVAPDAGGNADAVGISASTNESSITGNRIRGLAPAGTGVARGIQNVGIARRVIVRDNDIQGPGSGTGVSCLSNTGTARDNVISGFATGVHNCLSSGNTVNTN